MQIGEYVTLSREDFIKLAPRGLMLYNPSAQATFCYSPSMVPRCHGRYEEVPGFVYYGGRHTSIPTAPTTTFDHLRGYWRDLPLGRCMVIRLPQTTVYRRTACE